MNNSDDFEFGGNYLQKVLKIEENQKSELKSVLYNRRCNVPETNFLNYQLVC